MKKIEIPAEELEVMNYNDIAYVVLEENQKKMRINTLFKEVCKILNIDEEEYSSYIAEFFELLSTDKRFTMLEDGQWDLKIKHNKGMIIEEDSDDEDEEIPLEENIIDEEICDDEAVDDDIDEDDLSDLVIIDDGDEENNM